MPDFIKQSPEFFAEASAVMNAPYWACPSIADARQQTTAAMQLLEERQLLSRALEQCRTYDDLTGEAKAIYDRAKQTLQAESPPANSPVT